MASGGEAGENQAERDEGVDGDLRCAVSHCLSLLKPR